MTQVRFEILGMRLVNPTNEHAHWRVRSARAKEQRQQAKVRTQAAGGHLLAGPYVVRITRRGPGRLDSDSLPPSGKHVRDGIADALGIDDGDDRQAVWTYAQERARVWSVVVEITRAGST